ncbi:unnamed protein product [Caenorhabditis angaria]|uniref:VWFA domain-containing protein n=1 Tax=Caenorhabditis angaria TaxID=860376 RepID=A0A9P1IWE8_9PELO|nr:unnamed protein product [Caenorhabditis angaria]
MNVFIIFAIFVGFSSASHICLDSPCSSFNVEADIVLVVDSSNAFSQVVFEQIRAFIYKFVNTLTISPIDSQVAIYAYGTSAQSVISLTGGSQISQLLGAINSTLKYQGSLEKNLFQALAKVSAEVTTNSGLRNADYKKILVVISGEKWTGNQVIGSSILTQLQQTYNILSVGVGSNSITDQASDLINLPGVTGNTFFAASLDQLAYISAWIASNSCSGTPSSTIAPPSTPLPSQSPSVSCPLGSLNYDVYLILDVSNAASAADFAAMKSAVLDFIAPFPVADGKTQFALVTTGMDSELYYTAFHKGQSRSDIINAVSNLLQDTTSGQTLNTALYAAQSYLSLNYSTQNKILVYFTSTTAWDVSPISTMQTLKSKYQVSPLAVQWGAKAATSDLTNFAGSNCVNTYSNKQNSAVWLQQKMCSKVFC